MTKVLSIYIRFGWFINYLFDKYTFSLFYVRIIFVLTLFVFSICGTLHSVDQYLNIKLTEISVTDPDKYPHMLSIKNCFIRGSVVRYVQLPADEVDTQLLQDAARKEAASHSQ